MDQLTKPTQLADHTELNNISWGGGCLGGQGFFIDYYYHAYLLLLGT
jgi:hypothetical protein